MQERASDQVINVADWGGDPALDIRTAPVCRYGTGLAALLSFATITCLAGLAAGPPMGDHECINALAARQSIQSSNWLIPHVEEIPWIRKPPLGTWLIAAASLLVDHPGDNPVSDFAARLPSAIAGLVNILVVTWLGTLLYGRRAGLVAGFISAGCLGTLLFARNAQVEMALTCLTTLSFACFWRGAIHQPTSKLFMALFYVAFAGAMLAKAPLPLVIIGFPLAVYWFVTMPLMTLPGPQEPSGVGPRLQRFSRECGAQGKRLGRLWIIPGGIVFLILAGAWPLYVYRHIDNAWGLWQVEFFDRFQGELSGRSRPFLYYVPIIFGLTVPYLLSLPEALLAVVLPRYRTQRTGLAFVLTWALAGTLFLSLSSFKRPHYLAAVLPAYCLLLAPVVDRLFFGTLLAGRRLARLVGGVLPLLLAVGLVIAGIVLKRQYPALLPAYTMVGALILACWTAACVTRLRDGGATSFALLQLGMVVLAVFIWPLVGLHINRNTESSALVRAFAEHGITQHDAIYWVDGRPDSSIAFYHGYHVRRLVNEMEMAGMRHGRRIVTDDIYREFAKRIRRELARPTPVYLIISRGRYDMLTTGADIPNRIVFNLIGFEDDPEDDPVVISQPAK